MIATAPETMTDLDTAWEIPCGGQQHINGTHSHIIEQTATRAVIAPCCGFRLLLCQGRGDYLRNIADAIHCSNCDHDSMAWKWQFELISGTESTR